MDMVNRMIWAYLQRSFTDEAWWMPGNTVSRKTSDLLDLQCADPVRQTVPLACCPSMCVAICACASLHTEACTKVLHFICISKRIAHTSKIAQQQHRAVLQITFAERWQPESCVQPVEPAQLASGAAAAVLHYVAARSACVLAAHVPVTAPVHYRTKDVCCLVTDNTG